MTSIQLEAEEAYEMRRAIESTIRLTERELKEGGLLPPGTGHSELAERARHSIDVLNGVLKKIPE